MSVDEPRLSLLQECETTDNLRRKFTVITNPISHYETCIILHIGAHCKGKSYGQHSLLFPPFSLSKTGANLKGWKLSKLMDFFYSRRNTRTNAKKGNKNECEYTFWKPKTKSNKRESIHLHRCNENLKN